MKKYRGENKIFFYNEDEFLNVHKFYIKFFIYKIRENVQIKFKFNKPLNH